MCPLHIPFVSSKRSPGGRGYGGYAPAVLTEGEAQHAAVLVVDDEPAIRLLCRVNLELEGLRVLEAPTLGEARRQLAEEAIDLVLLDMRVGNERGDTLLDELNERRIPVVMVTGSVELDAAWTSRANAVLGKPFPIDLLLETVRSLLPPR